MASNSLTGRRVAVTGAGGFIGSRLTELLVEAGASVRALVTYNSRGDLGQLELLPPAVRSEIEIVRGDIRDPGCARRVVDARDLVFHLAALIAIPYSYEAPSSFVQVNVGGTLNLLDASLQAGVQRFIHTSTSEVYGTAQYVPMDEAHPLNTQSPYAASKVAADKLVESYFCSFELPAVIVRPFNTFGPRQSARAIIPTVISQALAGGPVRLGNLDPVRDLTYVDDTAAGFLRASVADGALGETFNLGTGCGIRIGDLVATIGRLLGRPIDVVTDDNRFRPTRSEVMRLVSDNRRAREVLEWEPQVSLESGLGQVIDWVSRHPGAYVPNVYAK